MAFLQQLGQRRRQQQSLGQRNMSSLMSGPRTFGQPGSNRFIGLSSRRREPTVRTVAVDLRTTCCRSASAGSEHDGAVRGRHELHTTGSACLRADTSSADRCASSVRHNRRCRDAEPGSAVWSRSSRRCRLCQRGSGIRCTEKPRAGLAYCSNATAGSVCSGWCSVWEGERLGGVS